MTFHGTEEDEQFVPEEGDKWSFASNLDWYVNCILPSTRMGFYVARLPWRKKRNGHS